MSRLFVLTFRGTERFREETDGHDPHESPWVMTVPLVVLAALSIVGGVLDLPWVHHDSLGGFLSPTFGFVAPVAVTRARSPSTAWRRSTSPRRSSGSSPPSPSGATSPRRRRYESRSSNTSGIGTTPTTRPLAVRSPHAAQFGDDVIEPKVIDGAVDRRGGRRSSKRRGPAQGAVGLRAPLRPRDGARPRGRPGLPRSEGRLVMHSSIWLTLLIVVPLAGALGAALAQKVDGARLRGGRRDLGRRTGRSRSSSPCLYNAHVAGAQTFDFATRHVLSAPFGLAYDVAHRRHLAPHGRPDRARRAAGAARRPRPPPGTGLRRVAAAADVLHDGQLPVATTSSSSSSSSSSR